MVSAAQVVPLVEARALDRTLDYAVPEDLAGEVGAGSLVACPLGPRRWVLGVVLSLGPPTHEGRLVPLAGVVAAPPVPERLLDLALWVSRYYVAPMVDCLRLVLPPRAEGALRRDRDGSWVLRAPPADAARLVASEPAEGGTPRQRAVATALAAAGGAMPAAELCRAAGTTSATLRRMAAAGLLRLERETQERSGLDWFGTAAAPALVPGPTPTAAQAAAIAAIVAALERGEGSMLLHGVTGSGKTEVYLSAIEAARARGRSSLVLVPEIALTPQMLGRLRARLGEGVAVWHSALAPAERAAEDRRVREGRADVVLGARSAAFAPLERLGLVIVDEEHEASYKQDGPPRYDARQVAWRRARTEGAVVVYGSATPRPESWAALPRLTLPERVDGVPLPPIEVVDMRTQPPGPISRPLAQALEDGAARGQKAIVLLNRRGFARMLLCRACGWIARCPACEVSLVLYRPPERVACHHCGAESPAPALCPACRSAELSRQGSGTEGLGAALERLLPGVRLVRLDAATTAVRGALPRLLGEFSAPGAAVLYGTQMVAKGHDLPDVAVAGVVDADGALQRPDFRAEERAFSLIVQLAGRAGRRGEAARVIVQAYEPAARAVRLGAAHDVERFLVEETARRRERGFPPFAHLVRAVVEGEEASAVHRAALALAEDLRAAAPEVDVLGPAPLHRLRGRHRRAMLVRAGRAADAAVPLRALVDARGADLRRAGVRAVIDVDPQET